MFLSAPGDLLDIFPETAAECIPVNARIEALREHIEKIPPEKKVVVLVTGDP